MAKKFKVCVVTGTRAEFGIWRPVLEAIGASKKLKLQLVVTGMHLLKAFGMTVRDVEASGYPIAARVAMYKSDRRKFEEAAGGLSHGISGLAAAYRRLKPGIVLVLGDRLEMLAAASAALAERIPMGHVHGGETAPGVWDEQIRHAITKMAHVHFCATTCARQRIIQMGEAPGTVHEVGAAALDRAVAFWREMPPRIPVSHSLPTYRPPILLLHPSSADEQMEYRRTVLVLRQLRKVFLRTEFYDPFLLQVVGPNNDPGHRGILRAYAEYSREMEFRMSMPQEEFWELFKSCGLLIGNSSSGIIEAASFAIPVINIGDRQAGRERNANVIDVGWDAKAIHKAIHRATTDRVFLRMISRRKNIYGDGHASDRIVAVLEKIAKTGLPLEKRFVDLPASRNR